MKHNGYTTLIPFVIALGLALTAAYSLGLTPAWGWPLL